MIEKLFIILLGIMLSLVCSANIYYVIELMKVL